MHAFTKIGKTIVDGLQIGANFAAVCGLIVGIYAFVYPAAVADYGAEVLELMQQTGADVSAIRDSSAATATNTEATADNTAKLAAAIPNWLTFGMADLELTHKVFYGNASLGRIDFTGKFLADGKVLDEFEGFALPNEDVTIDAAPDLISGLQFREFTICIIGTNTILPDTMFYEQRIFRSPTPKSELGQMAVADIQFEPFANCPA